MGRLPNIVHVYADDLGRGMLSCYGQRRFQTPNIDRIAREGMRFQNAYGCAMCAPARASLLCGIHDVHAGRWTFTKAGIYQDMMRGKLTLEEVYELIHNAGIEQRAGDVYLPMLLRQAGYVTGQIGKLEWGFATTGDEIARHGWDSHYGYYDHQMCHGYYPPFVFENGEKVLIEGNTHIDCGKGLPPSDPDYERRFFDREGRAVFCQDLFDQKILEFLRAHRDGPFYLYHPTMIPHGVLSIPELHPEFAECGDLTFQEKVYASMVKRLDHTVGLVLDELDRLDLAEDTLVIFSSDNGHTPYAYHHMRVASWSEERRAQLRRADHLTARHNAASIGDVFNGNDGMSGFKCSNWEGGARVPFLARWPGRIAPGTASEQLIAGYDVMPTLADLAGTACGPDKDGLSFLPCLLGREMRGHDYVVYGSSLGPALVTRDGWKVRAVINQAEYRFEQFGAFFEKLNPGAVAFQLYRLKEDYEETRELSREHPEQLRRLSKLLLKACDGNVGHGLPQWHFAFYPEGLG